jgi:capsular exopolysaccharide synthesis family protein
MTTLPQTATTRLPRPVGQGPITVAGPAHHAPTVAGVGMTAGDVWRVIRANTWLLVGGLILAGIIGYGVNFLLNRYYARYTARGWIQINSSRAPNPLNPDTGELSIDTNLMAIEQRTHASLLRTDGVFTRFLQNGTNVKNTEWYKQFLKKVPQADGTVREVFDMANAKDDLNEHVGISPVPDTKLIEVNMTFRVPKDCRIVVEELVNQYLQEQGAARNTKDSERSQTLSSLKNQLVFRQQTLADDVRRLQTELNKAGISPSGRTISPKEIELDQMVKSQADIQLDLGKMKGEYDSVAQKIQNGETPTMVDQAIDNDQQVMSLRSEVTHLEIGLKQLGSEKNPQYQRTQAALDETQKQLDERTAELRAKYTIDLREKLESAVSGLSASLQSINERIDRTKDELGDLDFKLIQYLSKMDEDKLNRDTLKTIEDQLRTIQAGGREGTVIWGRPPETPDIPSFPNLLITMSIAISCGLMLCLGIAFARELLDTSVRSPRDISRVGQMNLLGMIPHEDDDPQSAGVPLAMVIAQAPTSIIAEQFRQVRTRLQHAASLDTTRSILVTSPGPQDGKTTVAVNLAAGLALNGRKILLVDANFRRPELHKLFQLDNSVGLSTVLGSMDSFSSAVHQTSVPNLDVMSSGPKPGNPTELLESQLLIDFIEKALEEYDHVVFDSGPMLLVSETVALAPRVDGVVTVVRARSNSRGLLQRMRDQLRQLKAEHLGVVLNAVRSQGGGYYGRNIKTYYEYQNGHAA